MEDSTVDLSEGTSKLEGLTIWGRARAILMGKSRGRNMLVLGIFLVVMSGIADALSYASGIPSEVGHTLRVFGALGFGAGIVSYLSRG